MMHMTCTPTKPIEEVLFQPMPVLLDFVPLVRFCNLVADLGVWLGQEDAIGARAVGIAQAVEGAKEHF